MERISSHQFTLLGSAVLMGTTFLPIASMVTGVAGRDSWLSVLPGFALGIPYGLMVLALMEQYPQKNLLQITEILWGKWISKIIGILYVLIMIYFGGLLLGQLGDMYESSIMPRTPIEMFYLGGLLLVLYLVKSGIEVFARFSEVLFPLIVFALVLNIGLSIPRVEQGELMPLLSQGMIPIFWGGTKIGPFVMEYILFLAGVLPFLSTNKGELLHFKRGLWKTIFLVGILNTLVVLIQILVFGPSETVNLVYGLLVLGKMVEVSKTIAGVESLFLGVWFAALVIKISAFFFAIIWGLKSIFNAKGFMCNLVVGIIFMGIALKFQKGPALKIEIGFVDNYLIFPFASVWVLTLWGMSYWKKKAGVS
ncbi:endospore germination permease [Desulfosporosinus sp.]|uniref:GerAB/ArcD/ProY family transporter n=1 Tax=Desulfosporosinus sp. TaxID=157907 RepID=UPI0025C1489E|nr:endospore germination permease [Desulfosporosinus sp.]MBC2724080.1 endospore germination permease [Desulfosporosinus sp.]MBC2727864.1 endospore germination permease [Desulfosporosinus sp.]